MESTEKRCRIRIPQWRADELEAWLNGLAAEGWELKEIRGSKAIFRRSTAAVSRYFCQLVDPEDAYSESDPDEAKTVQKEDEHTNSRIESVERLGWRFAALFGDTQIYTAPASIAVSYPHSQEAEAEGMIRYYKKHEGKFRIPWDAITAACALLFDLLINPARFFTSPFLSVLFLFWAYTLISIPVKLIRRNLTIRGIINKFETAPAHHYADTAASVKLNGKYIFLHRIHSAAAALVILVYFMPAIPFGLQLVRYGFEPPVPAGELPVVRLSNLKADAAAAAKPGNEENNYQAIEGLLLPMHCELLESDSTSTLYSYRYQTLAPWHAGLLAQAIIQDEIFNFRQLDHPEEYGFDSIWVSEDESPKPFGIIAVKGSTVYRVIFFGPDASQDDALLAMQKKAG